MARNSCREPFSHTSIASVRQRLPSPGGRALTAQLEVFNVLNRPTFGAPNTTVANASFGLISTQSNRPRQVQIGARLVF